MMMNPDAYEAYSSQLSEAIRGYPKGAIVKYQGRAYISLFENNLDEPEPSDKWSQISVGEVK